MYFLCSQNDDADADDNKRPSSGKEKAVTDVYVMDASSPFLRFVKEAVQNYHIVRRKCIVNHTFRFFITPLLLFVYYSNTLLPKAPLQNT